MKVLGIACGRRMSNTEIMVKEALMGAEEAGAEVEFLRLHDLDIKPCTGCNSCVVDLMERHGSGKCTIRDDDFAFIDEKIMECDGLIVGSPIYEKSPSGQLKSLNDRMGPSHDVGFRMIAKKIREQKGVTEGTGPDERAFKPRAGVTIAVGGSEWDTLAMPMMGLFMLPLQVAVVDNIVVNWVGLPRTIVLRNELIERAHRAGKQVVDTLKKGFGDITEAEYLGEPGLCGVRGTLSVTDGKVSFTVSDEDRPHSHLLLSGKFEHLDELANRSLKPPANMDEVGPKSLKYRNYLTPLKLPARDSVSDADSDEALGDA